MKTSTIQTSRNSAISLIKVLGMLLICISHITPDFGNPGSISYISSIQAATTINEFYIVFSKYLGQIGVCIFVICAAYYLVDRKEIRLNKVICIELDSIIIGAIVLLLLFFWGGRDVISFSCLKALLPFSMSSNWFVPCYIIYYISVPYLNKVLNNCSKSELMKVCTVLFVLYSVLQMIFKDRYYSNHLVGFISIHFFTGYYKKFLKDRMDTQRSCCLLTVSFVALLILIMGFNSFALAHQKYSDKMQHFRTFMNPLILLFSFACINIAIHNKFCSSFIDRLSSLTLFIYVFHENDAVKNSIRPYYFNQVYNALSYDHIALICLASAVAVLIVSVILSLVYNSSIHRITEKLSYILANSVRKGFAYLTEKI